MTAVAVPQQQEQRILLTVTWEGYVQIGETLRDQPVRMTYDRGTLEIMTLSLNHEWVKTILGRMVELLLMTLKVEFLSGGSTTFARKDLKRGLEPDECYWVQHEMQMRGKRDYDSTVDPPPDLVIEVEISRSVLKRLRIYAALGVPEVWRCDGQAIEVLLLGADGKYQPSDASSALPMVPIAALSRFLVPRASRGEMQLATEFLEWAQEQQAAGWGTKKSRGRKKAARPGQGEQQ